jgi:hypothetical protein
MAAMRRNCRLLPAPTPADAAPPRHHGVTKRHLFELLGAGGPAHVTVCGVSGVLHGIRREDGSGSSFLLTIATAEGDRTVYVRTPD